MQGNNRPIIVLSEGTKRQTGRGVQSNNIRAAKAIGDTVRSTLGPRGLDKMLVDSMGDVVVTNDGVTILREIDVQHPAAKMVIEVARTQDQECGDGTTSSVVLAGELLDRADDLVDDLHPTRILEGYRLAEAKAIEVAEKMAQEVTPDDTRMLERIAHTAIAGKSAEFAASVLVDTAVEAVRAVADETDGGWTVDVDNVQVVKKYGGSVDDTELIDGLILDKERAHSGMPDRVEDARIALLNEAIEVKKTQIDAEIEITDPDQLERFLEGEQDQLREMVTRVQDAGANVLFCQKGIDDLAQHLLAKRGVYAIENVSRSDMEMLERATGGRISNDVDDLAKGDLGLAGSVADQRVAGDHLTFVTGCENARAVSILVRGGTEHVADEVERALEDGLRVVGIAIEDGKLVPGGGAPEVEMSLRLHQYASTVGGREQLAVEAFADALEVLPRTLAANAGLDAIDALVTLKTAHEGGSVNAGLDLDTGEAVDMLDAGVVEPLRVKTQALQSATEVATMILRIDDVIASKDFGEGDGGQEMPDLGAAGPPGGMGGMPGGMPPM